MKQAQEYLKHADECRALARRAATEQERKQLTAMAETWLNLAEERLRVVEQGFGERSSGVKSDADGAMASSPKHSSFGASRAPGMV